MANQSTAPDFDPATPLGPLQETAVALVATWVPNLQALYCFGSVADGASRPDSDVDLAALAATPLGPLDRWRLQEELAALLGRDVDLVDLRAASAVMRVQVLAHDTLLIDRDPIARAWFEMLALSDYARLNEERRAILADVKDRGRVY